MILEAALLHAKKEQQKQFEKDFVKSGRYISAMKGYIKHSLLKCLEHENQYLLFVDWENLNDHICGFRKSSQYQEWKKILHHYYEPFPTVEHYELIIENNREI